jgi:signal transduction histidine kinase/PleD family two-component response regulator
LTDQIAVAVDNARSYEVAQDAIQEARQRLQELSMLYSVSQSFASAPLEIAEIANLVARQFVKLLHVPECSVSTLDDTNKALGTLVAIRIDDDGEFIDLEDVGRIVPVSDYPGAEHALATLNPLVVNLSSSDVGDPAMQATLIRDGYSSQVIIPLAAKGQPIGIIELKSRGDERLTTPGELNLAMTLANQAAVALENASLYNEQRRTADQLREVDILKTQFLANMSHELRTPLNSIIGFSRVILKGIDGPVTNLQEQDLTAIYNAGQHLLGLINDILDLSKIEAGKMELSFEIINLVDLINSVMSTAVGLVKHKRIQLLKDLPKDLPPVNADPLRIRQVLLNLLSNAAKFTEEGSITVSAVLQDADKAGNQSIMVRVTDTGPGISPEDQKKLFQPFTQVDASPTRKTGGSGLGLSISLHLIEMHKGHIGVESEMEVGSTFYFSLQAVDPEELDGQVPRPINYIRQTGPLPALTEMVYDKKLILKETGELTMPAESYEQPKPLIQTVIEPSAEPIEVQQKREITNGPLILAVDKDPQIVALYDRYLNPGGYQVIPASDAEQALVFARANQPTLITLDVMANQYDGWQLLKDLKEDPVTQDIPVIVCSILEERDKAHELGASDYLVKPILEADLIDAVEQLVNQDTPGQPREDQVLQAIEVLIVDQDPADIRVLEMLLEDNGNFQISEAGDGRQALEAILTDQPDVIILNHLLPDMDAVTFIRTLRANPTIRDLPIILLTETELPEVMKQQLARNCKAIFHKAKINPEALLTNLLGATG